MTGSAWGGGVHVYGLGPIPEAGEEELLDRLERSPSHNQVRSEGVAQSVDCRGSIGGLAMRGRRLRTFRFDLPYGNNR